MKRFFVIVLSVLLSFAVVDVSAQSFLKKLGDAVNKVQQVESQARQVKRTAEQEQQLPNEQFAEQPQQQQQSQSQMPEQYYEEQAKAYGTHNGHDWVDLGLPSGTRWATVNIGATAEHQAGCHYSWAELKTKSSYSDTNYKYGSADLGDISGNPQYDIAAAEWGGEWRMPTKEELGNSINPDLVNIINYHVPYYLEEFSSLGFDIQLSGHTHGGQFYPAVNFAWKLFKYNMGLFKNGSGKYLHVTTGVGSMDTPMRWGTDSELVVLKLRKK